MPNYTYRGINLSIPDNDSEYQGYFAAAAEGRLVVKKCSDCGLLRGEPGPGCPWCTSINWEWQQVSGKGTIYFLPGGGPHRDSQLPRPGAVCHRAGGAGRAERSAQ